MSERPSLLCIILPLFSYILSVSASAEDVKPRPLTSVPIQEVTIEDEFWSPKIKVWREITIPDCLAKFEKDGVILNFEKVRDGAPAGKYGGLQFFDGLTYEMICGCADFLAARRDPELERRLDAYITCMAAAQARGQDGYLNTSTQLREPEHRWGLNGGDDKYQHDLYNAGMLVEAGVHYFQATGKIDLLRVATKQANLMCDVMGPAPKANVVPGHSGPEEPLVKLWQLYREQPALKQQVNVPVDEARYLKLVEFWIENRGNHVGRGGAAKSWDTYSMDDQPVLSRQTIDGHAVRATLLGVGIVAAGVADNRQDYLDAAVRLWTNMVERKMYITGGLGAIEGHEGFGPDYELPNTGYLETCAAISGGFFHHRLNLTTGDARYADEFERVLYNGALCGVSLAGNAYAYINPLAFERGHERWQWHGCPCCPPMFLKMMGALPGYIYAQNRDSLFVNLFIGSCAKTRLADMRQTTKYPWEGTVRIAVEPREATDFDVNVRIPSWCRDTASTDALYQSEPSSVSIAVNGQKLETPEIVRGYARLRRHWNPGDVIELQFDMPVRRVRVPKVAANRECVSLMRGPIVFAVEPVVADLRARDVFLPPDVPLTAEYRNDLLGGVTVVRGGFQVCHRTQAESRPVDLVAIPYFAYLNRGPSDLRVWIPEYPCRTASPPVTGEAGARNSNIAEMPLCSPRSR